MNITRQDILSTLKEQLEPHPKVIALWLEGADALGMVDEYSDIDICCSVEAGAIQEVAGCAKKALEILGVLDLEQDRGEGEEMRSIVFHLAGTSEYLMLDFDFYVGRGSTFAEGDNIEKPLVLFDKGPVIRILSQAEYLPAESREQRIQHLQKVVRQRARIVKYVRRRQFIEAFACYRRWLLEPLIEALRMRYTPLHPDYYIVHISRHLPEDVLMRLEDLYKVNSVEEIGVKSKQALTFFEEAVAKLQEEINQPQMNADKHR